MRLRVDEIIGAQSNYTISYWERVSYDMNGTKAPSVTIAGVNVSIAKENNKTTYPVLAYLVIYDSLKKKITPKSIHVLFCRAGGKDGYTVRHWRIAFFGRRIVYSSICHPKSERFGGGAQ